MYLQKKAFNKTQTVLFHLSLIVGRFPVMLKTDGAKRNIF